MSSSLPATAAQQQQFAALQQHIDELTIDKMALQRGLLQQQKVADELSSENQVRGTCLEGRGLECLTDDALPVMSFSPLSLSLLIPSPLLYPGLHRALQRTSPASGVPHEEGASMQVLPPLARQRCLEHL